MGQIAIIDVIVHGIKPVTAGLSKGILRAVKIFIRNRIGRGRQAESVNMEKQAYLFFQGHLGKQVGNAVFSILAPVLVYIQFAVVVQVAELVPVHLDDVFYAGFNGGLL